MARREFKGAAAATTLSAGITNASTTITIADATNWPDGSVGPFAIVIGRGTADEEKVLVTSRSGTDLTCLLANRGYDDTSATSHSAGVAVEHCLTSVDLDEANEHINDTAGAHAATAISAATHGSIVGTTVQAQLEELESEKSATGHTHADTGIAETLLDAKGDIIVATAADTAARKAVGANGSLLVADSGQSDGLRWAGPDGATVATEETTASTSYTDLATAGPAVTVTVGASGKALVILSAELYNTSASSTVLMGFAVSGASTVAASDDYALTNRSSGASHPMQASRVVLVTGLTAGSNTFTAKYRTAANTGGFRDRQIAVIPF